MRGWNTVGRTTSSNPAARTTVVQRRFRNQMIGEKMGDVANETLVATLQGAGPAEAPRQLDGFDH